MQVTLNVLADTKKGESSTVRMEVTEEVRLPWNRSVVLAFEGFAPELKEKSQEDILLSGYHLGCYRGYVSGVAKSVPQPQVLAYSADRLIENAAFRDIVFPKGPDDKPSPFPHYVHPTGWIGTADPNLWQVPQGSLAAGLIVARDATTLTYGRRSLPSDAVERKALARAHITRLLEVLGYVKVEPSRRPTAPPSTG